MTRLLLSVLITATFLCAVLYAHHKTAVTGLGPSDVTVGTARLFTAPKPVTKRPLRHREPRRTTTCTDTHWKHTLEKQERWIDAHESGLNPASVEPSTGAFGLGQLLPSTYANLGLVMSSSPCRQIAAQRAYMAERYGSWAHALGHWQAVGWW